MDSIFRALRAFFTALFGPSPVAPKPAPAPGPQAAPSPLPASQARLIGGVDTREFARDITEAAKRNNVPAEMLARLLWMESRFRDDIITGRTRSPKGAVGIAQFLPDTARELGIDPLDPQSAIDGAARYLRQLRNALPDWTHAVAAYNWGIGNVRRKGLANAPKETRDYVAGILNIQIGKG